LEGQVDGRKKKRSAGEQLKKKTRKTQAPMVKTNMKSKTVPDKK
tara:strand:+ start:310 stop:441 length:132 start_codon:yes stop_codon:yes gene_type:complete